ncbi:MAG: hypothetical protein EOP39_25395 [Rubrivivax sp.]|nr:MAG: hypothetical protein EOP39_25395 [Rubrivivax sp.]
METWAIELKGTGAKPLKSLILKTFGNDPDFLWITLLKSLLQPPESLVNQGSGWNARKNGNPLNLYESTTCERLTFVTGLCPTSDFSLRRNTAFVHKSSCGRRVFDAFPA